MRKPYGVDLGQLVSKLARGLTDAPKEAPEIKPVEVTPIVEFYVLERTNGITTAFETITPVDEKGRPYHGHGRSRDIAKANLLFGWVQRGLQRVPERKRAEERVRLQAMAAAAEIKVADRIEV